MNKKNSRSLSKAGTTSVGELRKMIAASRGRGGMSCVNPQIPLERALEIYAAALSDRSDEEIPPGVKEDVLRPGRMRATKDSLLIRNILRDCAR